jgi:hypothetical protein
MLRGRILPVPFALAVMVSGASCIESGGGGGGEHGFRLVALSVPEGAVWPINREIAFTFSQPVDFASVSANTLNIRSHDDVPAVGVFRLREAATVVFQPTCPTRPDLSDAGLLPGGVPYVVRVAGQDGSDNTVRSASGVPLALQLTRRFTTPAATRRDLVFEDSRSGPPLPVLRPQGSAARDATYLEVGLDPEERVYFELGEGGLALSEPGFLAPLNLYSERASRVAIVIAFDQPVDPEPSNVAPSRLRLEYRDARGSWRAIDTRASLEANCTETGARVRLEPVGVLPASSAVRAVVLPGFQDLVGEPLLEGLGSFALAPTRSVDFDGLVPPDRLADALVEPFDSGPESPLSLLDASALTDSPAAEWGGGRLSAAFSFESTGGPDGEFDWIVRTGERFFFDTTSTQIIGGPGGLPTAALLATGGVVDVRNLVIEQGAEVRVQGPNPLRIRATGEVRIDGVLDLSGFNARNVVTIDTGNQVEVGGVGVAGGGKGGDSNENTRGPTVRGGRGEGPFQQVGLGGEGGEMGVAPGAGDNRRPGGGGGGRLARDWLGTSTPASLSVAATSGGDGHPSSQGADPFDGHRPARGGRPGAGAFIDASDANDFFGVKPVVTDGELTALVRGELPGLWGGYGGGGGGNASQRFPNPGWTLASDEKGGGGGGAAGGVHVQALGRIVFGPEGQILANGARGGTGENTFDEPRLGGTGGGGSGGHVILETAALVDFTGGGRALDARPREALLACGPPRRTENPFSNGGAGGSGVIQIHVPDPRGRPGSEPPADVLVPRDALAAADVLDQVTSPPAFVLVPSFGKRSRVRSKWISIGGADQKPDGSEALVRFLFEGTDRESGGILRDGERVSALAPLVADDDLARSESARILADGFTLELTGAALEALRTGSTSGVSNDLYLRTPALLEGCAVRMRVVGADPDSFEDFPVAGARYDEGAPGARDERLLLTVGAERGPLSAFNPDGESGPTGLQLLPRFFHVLTNGVPDALPATAFVSVRFQAAAENRAGAPEDAAPLVDWTADITRFNALPAGALQFFRFEVEFDLDLEDRGIGADTEPVTLDFLRIPFVF